MHDSVDHHHADVARLADHAVRAGTTIRRRRRLATAGAVLAVGVLAVGGAAAGGLLGDAGPSRSDLVADAPGQAASPSTAPSMAPSSGATPSEAASPVTEEPGNAAHAGPEGRIIVEALVKSLDGLGEGDLGTVEALRGQPGYAEIALTPADGQGAGIVGVNVQDWAAGVEDLRPDRCLGWMRECEVSRLPDGSRLRVYEDRTVAANGTGTGVRSVAERLDDSGLRVVVAATNGFERDSSEWDITRPDPVLTRDQLVAVVSDPAWAMEMPAGSATSELPGYEELPTTVEANPTPTS